MINTNTIVRFLSFALVMTSTQALFAAEPNSTDNSSPVPRFAIGAEIGTAGYGPVTVFTVSKHFTVDVGYTWMSYSYDYTNSDADYNAKLKLSNIQGRINWHPFAGTFHLSAGAFQTDNKIDLVGKPKAGGNFSIGDADYTAAQVGNLTGTAEIGSGVAPFVGLGWSKTPAKKGFGFFFDVGVLFIDAPTVTMNVTGPIAIDPTFKANLQKEIRDMNDDLSSYKYYPIVQLGLLYRF
ncbi:MAG: hypothetical protein QM790_16340 [Nibricoccus sp.]